MVVIGASVGFLCVSAGTAQFIRFQMESGKLMRYRGRKIAGLSLVEAMIVAALISLVFGVSWLVPG